LENTKKIKKSDSKTYFFEYFGVFDLIKLIGLSIIYKITFRKSNFGDFYWIDASIFVKKNLLFFRRKLGLSIRKLDFRMMEIRSYNGELTRLTIPRKDLFMFRDKIFKRSKLSRKVKIFENDSRLYFYLIKSMIKNSILDENSLARALYLIQVVAQNNVSSEKSYRELILRCRPWKLEYEEYANELGIKLRWCNRIISKNFFRSKLENLITGVPKLYTTLKKLKTHNKYAYAESNRNYICVEGRDEPHLINDGGHSDFSWLMNSKFPSKRIVYPYKRSRIDYCYPHRDIEKELNDCGIRTFDSRETSAQYLSSKINNKKSDFKLSSFTFYEKKDFSKSLSRYRLMHGLWSGFFKKHSIKIYMTWYKFDESHIVSAEAIKSLGGVSVINQLTFDGYGDFGCMVNTDVVFGFSKWSASIEKKVGSVIPYYVVTGFHRDHVRPLLETRSIEIRKKLKQTGVKKIITVLDENGLADDRWHTGVELQKENYRFVLEKLVETAWLGVIFKPKAPGGLRERLGEVNELLCDAEKSGRCIVLDGMREDGSVEVQPVLLAGLASDVCIHSDLSAGTAAIECALEGIPTLLIDREHALYSKLNQLPKDEIVFRDWTSAIEVVMDYFSSENIMPGFGDWQEILDDMDSFRDGKASFRIGTYLKWMIEGFDSGLDREVILEDSANKYVDLWGADKIISVN